MLVRKSQFIKRPGYDGCKCLRAHRPKWRQCCEENLGYGYTRPSVMYVAYERVSDVLRQR